MIGECFDSGEWGSTRKAASAAKNRAAQLYTAGYATYQDRKKTLSGRTYHYVFAFQRQEDHDLVYPRHPDSTDRTLNIRTAHIGLRVEVPVYEHTDPPAYAGLKGTVKALELTEHGAAWITVQMDEWPEGPHILFQAHELIQEGSKS